MEIGKLERFAADMAIDGGFLPLHVSKKTSGSVALIGSGPARMAAARELALRDYDVTIFEASSHAGGTTTYGIPTFRLHKEIVWREADLLEKMGVTIQYDTKIGVDKTMDELQQQFDAVCIGVGTMDAWSLGVDNDTVEGVVNAEQFMCRCKMCSSAKNNLKTCRFKKATRLSSSGQAMWLLMLRGQHCGWEPM